MLAMLEQHWAEPAPPRGSFKPDAGGSSAGSPPHPGEAQDPVEGLVYFSLAASLFTLGSNRSDQRTPQPPSYPSLQSGPLIFRTTRVAEPTKKGAKCLSHLKQPALPPRGLEFYDRRGGGKGKDAKRGQERRRRGKNRSGLLSFCAQLVVVQ